MKPLFADTSFYIAILNLQDSGHEAAVHWSQMRLPTIVTEFVLIELANFFPKAPARLRATEMIEGILRDSYTRIIPATHDLFQEGWILFRQRPDKEWSLTDCISFIVMENMELTEALTTDGHFSQAGFKALLRKE